SIVMTDPELCAWLLRSLSLKEIEMGPVVAIPPHQNRVGAVIPQLQVTEVFHVSVAKHDIPALAVPCPNPPTWVSLVGGRPPQTFKIRAIPVNQVIEAITQVVVPA